jgi:hypothetical protein
MKPLFVRIRQWYILSVVSLPVFALQPLQAQQILEAIGDPHSQADYVIISPPSYTTIMQQLATHRGMRSNLRVAIVTTDAIYQIFGQGVRPDSAIRAFVTFTLTSWSDPKPQYFLLAGNVNMVPSHKEAPLLPEYEDSIMVDQWFVEGLPPYNVPAAALGRLPAWDQTQLQTMVGKTIDYENASGSVRVSRSIAVADYYPQEGFIFEEMALSHQTQLANLWSDTVTVHVRQDSPLYLSRVQFRNLWNQGAAIVSLIGHANFYQFSHDRYFTTWDVDSLSNVDLLSFFMIDGSQRFEKFDTLAIVVKLLQAPLKGAVATFAPSGLHYAAEYSYFHLALFQRMTSHPQESIGQSILAVKVLSQASQTRKYTLLGDPALVIKNPLLAGGGSGGGSVPETFSLHQNFPNPFNPTTQIGFDLPQSGAVTLKLFNLLGQELGTLLSGSMNAGTHTYTLNADAFRLGSGVYFYRLTAGDLVQTRKMILVK